MWFIDVPKYVCAKPILPWYHEEFDASLTSTARTNRKKTPFDKSILIQTNSDIDLLRKETENHSSTVRFVRIQPQEESLLREKNTLHQIGELTRKIGAVILMEGGVLSHAYYQLMKTGAAVEVINTFDDFEDNQEFNKLVRDKIPSKIESGGEYIKIAHLKDEQFLRALREKLVEEAIEALDANDQESIIEELADISEVVEGILDLLKVNKDELQNTQEHKKKKVGGFKKGLVLLKTTNPLPTKKEQNIEDQLFKNQNDFKNRVAVDDRGFIDLDQQHDIKKKWSDVRDHQTSTELIFRILIPIVRDNWVTDTPETLINDDSGNIIKAKIVGKRLGSNLQV